MSTASCMILHRSRPEPWNGSDPRLKQAEYQETAFLFRRSAVSLHIQENMAFRGTKLHLTFGCFCVILKSEYELAVHGIRGFRQALPAEKEDRIFSIETFGGAVRAS